MLKANKRRLRQYTMLTLIAILFMGIPTVVLLYSYNYATPEEKTHLLEYMITVGENMK